MMLKRGILRLGFGSALLWFVFWAFAYVLKPPLFEGTPMPPLPSPSTDAAILAIAILVAALDRVRVPGRERLASDG
jgi:hypothetical protein